MATLDKELFEYDEDRSKGLDEDFLLGQEKSTNRSNYASLGQAFRSEKPRTSRKDLKSELPNDENLEAAQLMKRCPTSLSTALENRKAEK